MKKKKLLAENILRLKSKTLSETAKLNIIKLASIILEQQADQGNVQQSSNPGLPELTGNDNEDKDTTSRMLTNYYNDGPAVGAGDINKLVGKNVYLWPDYDNQLNGSQKITFSIGSVKIASKGTKNYAFLYSSSSSDPSEQYVVISQSTLKTIQYFANNRSRPDYYYNSVLLNTVREFLKKENASDSSGTTKNSN